MISGGITTDFRHAELSRSSYINLLYALIELEEAWNR